MLEDADMGLHFIDVSRLQTDDGFADPLEDAPAPTTLREWKTATHPADLCAGLGTAEEAHQTIKSWLRELLHNPSTKEALAKTANGFSLHLLAPQPFAKAVRACALTQGWSKEGLWQGILANASWLENHGSCLTDAPGAEHKRSPALPVFFAGPPSSRKSSMKKAVCKTLFDDKDIPEIIRQGQSIAADATAKGLQSALLEYQRAGLESCEVSTVYSTSIGRDERGVHFANKSKILQYVNGERDATMTGHGTLHLDAPGLQHSKEIISRGP